MNFHLRCFLALGLLTSAQAGPDFPLMPLPRSVAPGSGSLDINGDFSIAVSGAGAPDDRVRASVERTFTRIQRQTGIPLRRVVATGQQASLRIVVDKRDHRAPQKLGDDESYSLEVANGQARLSAPMPLGALRGLETFLQLIQQNEAVAGQSKPGFSVPAVTIQDSPRFAWRGLSLDVSRHFLPVSDVERTLDGMAAVKLNVLHWHLSDDQGFRVESRKYPKLQEIASEGKYYTQAQVQEVIAYARRLGIRVVPEFDMPGHAAAILAAYPMLAAGPGPQMVAHNFGILTRLIDPTKESTYVFLDGLIGEMSKLFSDDYFHIGGDEVEPTEWKQNPDIQAFMKQHGIATPEALQTYFSRRVVKIVISHGKRVAGWDEVLQPDLPKTVMIQSWRGQPSLWQAASQGYDGLLSAGYYLDLMQPASQHYAIDPMRLPAPNDGEPASNEPPPPAPTPEQARHILGGEAAMWMELALPENLDAKLWPRLAAIAERLWSPETVTDVDSMYQRLAITNRWLEFLGLSQRTSLLRMRQRLAGSFPRAPLDTFASILEPVKGYERDSEKYQTETPLNRLIDSIPPESDAAREFRNKVDAYLQSKSDAGLEHDLISQLAAWQKSAVEVRPMMQANGLLTADLPLTDTVEALCRTAQEALASSGGRDAKWKEQVTATVEAGSKHQDSMLVAIAPAVRKLVNAVP
jgi:hexosaminidase